MARVTEEDREREVTIEWTETVHKTLTLDFPAMAKALKITQSELKNWLDEGDEADISEREVYLSSHGDAEIYEEEWEFVEIADA